MVPSHSDMNTKSVALINSVNFKFYRIYKKRRRSKNLPSHFELGKIHRHQADNGETQSYLALYQNNGKSVV